MKKESDNDAVEDSIAEITAAEEQGKAEVIADTRDERLGDHRPIKHKLFDFAKSGPGLAIIGAVLIMTVALIVPMTRYALVGTFLKKQTTITVVDELSGTPVSEAVVHFGRHDAKTDSKGVAKLDGVSVGDHLLSVEKKYYTTTETSYLVPINGDAKTTIKLKATGRVAAVTVLNAISGKPLAGATVTIGDTVATTDESGIASVALATKDTDQAGEVALKDFKTAAITVNTKDIAPSVEAKLAPVGSVYFISNRTGSYDVMSSSLDGSDQQVVVKGSGKEVAYELQLTPSPSRKYLAYFARRGADATANVYIVDTASGAINKIDNSAGAGVIGWIEDTFYFGLYDYANGMVKDKRAQLMGYNASSRQLIAVDSSKMEGEQQWDYAELGLSTGYQLVGNRIYYAKCWNYSSYYGGNKDRKASLMAVVDGKATSLKDVSQNGEAYCDTVASKPGMIYYRVTYTGDNHSDSYRYQPGKAVESVQMNDGELYNNRYTYLTSPNGQKTMWTETRDGKRVSFIGDADGKNEQQVGAATYEAYGWFGDDYVLYSKDGSELYVAAAGAPLDGAHKVADYFTQRGPGY